LHALDDAVEHITTIRYIKDQCGNDGLQGKRHSYGASLHMRTARGEQKCEREYRRNPDKAHHDLHTAESS
jgi:hypothetical protein